MSVQLHITLSAELLARVDAARGEGQPRADWVRRAVEQALVDDDGGVRGRNHSSISGSPDQPPAPAERLGAVEQALGSPGSPDAVAGVRGRVPAPVPAEQPADVDAILGEAAEGLEFNRGPRVRSSAAARPFRPAPKKGEK